MKGIGCEHRLLLCGFLPIHIIFSSYKDDEDKDNDDLIIIVEGETEGARGYSFATFCYRMWPMSESLRYFV